MENNIASCVQSYLGICVVFGFPCFIFLKIHSILNNSVLCYAEHFEHLEVHCILDISAIKFIYE